MVGGGLPPLADGLFLWMIFLSIFDSHEKCESVMISVGLAGRMILERSKNFSVAIFSDTLNVINV